MGVDQEMTFLMQGVGGDSEGPKDFDTFYQSSWLLV